MSGCQISGLSGRFGTVPVCSIRINYILKITNCIFISSLSIQLNTIVLYLKRPEMKTDVGHWVTPNRLWNIIWQSKISRNQHEYSLPKLHPKNSEKIRQDMMMTNKWK